MRTGWRGGAAIVFAGALASGCYEAAFPLDPVPLVDVDPGVPGTWRCLPLGGDADDAPALLTVTPAARPHAYDVMWQEEGDRPDRYEAYASRLSTVTFLNVREQREAGPPGRWFFMRANLLRPAVLHLQVVADTTMRGVPATAADVRAALERRRDDDALYTEAAVCARVGGGR